MNDYSFTSMPGNRVSRFIVLDQKLFDFYLLLLSHVQEMNTKSKKIGLIMGNQKNAIKVNNHAKLLE